MGVGDMPAAELGKHVVRLTASAVDRQSVIRDRVHSEGSVTVDQLVSVLGVSRMTVHRDLDMLEAEGVLRKVRGGATALRSSLFESDFPYRLTASVAAKEAIGRAAARFVEGGQAVVCDESTTTMDALRAIEASEAITVITNCFPTMQYVNESTKHRLISLGGDYVTSYQAFLGIICEQAITNVYADVLLASCSAVRGGSTYHQDQQIVAVKRAMIRSAPTRLLLLDSSKVDVGALYHLGEIRDFTHLITDEGTPGTFLDQVRESGLEVVVAPVRDTTG
jgi:DeoR/GlpR family transcriptional regulator of sugar metabolism